MTLAAKLPSETTRAAPCEGLVPQPRAGPARPAAGCPDGRELAANIFDTASATATALASVLPDPIAGVVLKAAAGLASLVATLVGSVGTDNAAELIAELQQRRDEGKITSAHVARDNKTISDAVAEMFVDTDNSD